MVLRTDIICVEENVNGRDFIIGDVHGNRRCLSAVLKKLRRGDRLFLVGDLTDRGHDSYGVIDLVVKNIDRIFSVRGNHESECLEAIACLEALALKNSQLFNSVRFKKFLDGRHSYNLKDLFADFNWYERNKCATEYEKIEFDLENHRIWLVDLFSYELRKGCLHVKKDHIEYEPESKIKQIFDYMENLPYIIQVKGGSPFNVVHSDMPFDNATLLSRIQQGNLHLTEQEKAHAPWARGDSKSPFLEKTNTNGMITYVGHNIIEGTNLPILRRDSMTVNLDVATYDTDTSLVVNHTDKSSKFIGPGQPNTDLLTKKAELDSYLISLNTYSLPTTRSPGSASNFFEHVTKRRRLNSGDDVRIYVSKESTAMQNGAEERENALQNATVFGVR
jgi:hypothetical protein